MTGFVYFAQGLDGGPIKIGFSEDPSKRLRTLNTTSPDRLRLIGLLPGGELDEKRIHAALAAHRLNGEWFADHADVRGVLAPVLPPVPEKARPYDFWECTAAFLLDLRDISNAGLAMVASRDVALADFLEERGLVLKERSAAMCQQGIAA